MDELPAAPSKRATPQLAGSAFRAVLGASMALALLAACGSSDGTSPPNQAADVEIPPSTDAADVDTPDDVAQPTVSPQESDDDEQVSQDGDDDEQMPREVEDDEQVPTQVDDGEPAADETPSPPSIDELVALGTPLNLAHAGGDQSWPHSTAYAFSEAVVAGADLLEMDVRLTADGQLIVHHDDTVDRTTEIEGLVADMTLAELQELDNAYWFRPGCWACQDNDSTDYPLRGVRTGDQAPPAGYTPDDFRIETFTAIATRFPDIALDIEIKGDLPGARSTAETLAEEIRELDREDSVIVVAFDDEIVDAFSEVAPEVEVSPGTSRLTEWFLSDDPLDERFRIIQVPPVNSGIEVITEASVTRAHDEGLTVWAWANDASTQENAAFYQQMLDLGVDGFITGRPELFPTS